MLQRDYILRLIREFMAALERMLEKKEVADRREEIKQLYEQYVGPYALYHNATIDEVLLALAGMDEEQRLPRMEMLAELFYAEADTVSNPERDFLLEKAFALFSIIERDGKTYSLKRRWKMQDIQERISNGQNGKTKTDENILQS